MRAQAVDVRESIGKTICTTVFRSSGKKLLAKGHIIRPEDTEVLASEGLREIWVTELEDGEVGEDTAVCSVAGEIACGSCEIKLVAGGRANLFSTENCCMLLDEDLLEQVNASTSVVVATNRNFSYASTGQRIATIKSAPFAVAKWELDGLVRTLQERGPLLQARPIRSPNVAVLYTDPLNGERARQIFESIMRQRFERLGITCGLALACVEEECCIIRCLENLLRGAQRSLVLVASTTAPAGPEDVVGRALTRGGAQIERFLAPVEPGNLLILSYRNEIPVVSAPGCFRSAKPNVIDLLLPPLLARYRVSGLEVARLGHGGLLG